MPNHGDSQAFVDWFRHSAPYIHAHRGKTFVVLMPGEAVAAPQFSPLIHDFALLNSLGIRLLLVHGARPQIEERLARNGLSLRYHNGLRVTDADALQCVKEAVGAVRVEIEAALSMGLASTPMAGARVRVAAGNFVTARPLGIRDGVDFCYTGEVRRLDTTTLIKRLDQGEIVLLSPLGYSPTGEVFNLSAEELAHAAAVALGADKLLYLVTSKGVLDGRQRLIRELTPAAAKRWLERRRRPDPAVATPLRYAMQACRSGVRRAHLLDGRVDGALLQELFTRDGIGTLITAETFEQLRGAAIEDVGGILELLAPLEEEGVLVRRSRERLETEIDHFTVIERDGLIVGCAALYPLAPPHKAAQPAAGELACLVVHPEYRGAGRGDLLLDAIQTEAAKLGLGRLLVLTTRTAHWFRERDFRPATVKALPQARRALYNYQRNSKVFVKDL